MASLTTCMKKAGDALAPEDRAAILAAFNAATAAGTKPAEAARQAVDAQIAVARELVQSLSGGQAADPAQQWAAMSPADRATMLDAYFGAGMTDAGARYAGRAWDSFTVGERSTLTAAMGLGPAITRDQERALYDFLRDEVGGDALRYELLAKKFQRTADGIASAEDERITMDWLGAMKRDGSERQRLAAEGKLKAEADAAEGERKAAEQAAESLADLRAGKAGNERYRLYLSTLTQAERDAKTSTSDFNVGFMAFINARSGEFKRDGNIQDQDAFTAYIRKWVANNAAPKGEVGNPLDAESNLWQRISAGKATPDEFKAGFQSWLDNKAAIMEAMSKLKKDELLKMGGSMFAYRYKSENKPTIVEALWRDGMSNYTLGRGYSYGMSSGSQEQAVRTMVNATDADQLAQYAADQKAAEDEAVARVAKMAEAVKDPKTLDDFKVWMRATMSGGKTFKEARMMLTPEQRATFDELAAAETRGRRKNTDDIEKTRVRVAGQTVDGDIIATKHTKKGTDLFVVKLAERVSREDYDTLNAGAKRIGGYYSSFRGAGAVPGFQFPTREQAQAFVTLAAGDNTAAIEAAKERRDAFQDDRSQTAAERLTEMADRLEERADESMGRERKANTERRARFAANAEAAASADKAMAVTMRNIAQAITGGTAKFLDRVRQKVQVELLQGYVRSAKDAELRAKYPTYAEQERHRGEPATPEAADFAEFPEYTAYRSDLAALGRQLLAVDGTKKLGERLMKVADDVSDAYLKFAKENYIKVAAFSTREGGIAAFGTRDAAEASIARSGYKGKAIAYQVKRGDYSVILSPSEAIARGIWKGDGDKRITLSDEFGAELVEKIGKAARRGSKVSVPWQFETAYERRKTLARMGIETPAEFRAALREFISMREAPAAPDRVKQMERAMIGRRNDGLDFFPTPESTADEMVAAADIQPGMRVLEPSAGMGHIAERIRAAGVDPLVAEMSGDRRELLEAKGFEVAGSDFLAITEGDFDRIVMNPPFSDGRDIQHVRHAYDLLKPGGRLVAIMGESAFTNQNKRATEFREWLDSVGGTEEKLPEGTFNDPSLPVNTGANARMVVIEKVADAAADTAFSRGRRQTGVPMQDAKAVVDAIREALPNAPPIYIHETVRQAPAALRADIKAAGADNDVEAAFHAGEIHVFPGNIASIERMQFVVAHHEIRHYGFRGMLGPRLGSVMLGIYMGNANVREAAQAKMDAGLANTRVLAVEEALADMDPADIAKLKGVDKLMSMVRDFLRGFAARLRKLGMNTGADMIEPKGWTDADVARFVLKAENIARDGKAEFRTGGTVFAEPFSRADTDQTNTPEFKRWFGDSKVVDADGKPLVVYHGTPEAGGITEFNMNDGAAYFTSSEKVAASYTSKRGVWRSAPTGEVVPVYVALKNPLVVDALGKRNDNIPVPWQEWKPKVFGNLPSNAVNMGRLVEYAKANGHDGAIVRNVVDTADTQDTLKSDVFIAFRPEQIKSAIGNNGQFDPGDPDIRYSRAAGQNLTAQDLINAKGGVFDFNRYGASKQDRIRTFFDGSRPFWLGALTRDQIADMYGDEIPPVRDYDELTRAMENERQSMAQDADALYEKWSKLPADANERLARVMLDATVAQVHPDRDLQADATDDQRKSHAMLLAQFKLLPKEAQAIYREVRDYHSGTLAKLKTALEGRIERLIDNSKERAVALADIRQRFDQYLKGGPYFPLHRFGEFLVIAERESDGERVVAAYETAGEQQAGARALRADGFTTKLKMSKGYSRSLDGSAGKFIGDVLVAIDKMDLREATVNGSTTDMKAQLLDDLNQLFIKAMPDLSYRKHFTHRKGTAGFSADVMRGFASSAFHAASHIARLNHGDKMTFALEDAYKAIEQAPEGDFTKESQVLNELTKRHDAAMDPHNHPLSVLATQLGFVMYLGLSPAAGLINMLQVPMVALPWIGARYGFGKASATLGAAYKDIMAAAPNAKSGFNAAQSPKLTTEERRAMSVLQDEGVIDLTQAHDLAAATSRDMGNQARSKASFAIARAMKIVGWTFHVPEVMNRQVTALTAYRLEMAKSGDTEAAMTAAREAIKRTQFDYSSSNRARFMQGDVARVVLQFRQFSQNMTYFLGRAAYQALKGEDPEVRAIARRQILSTFAVTGAMAGTMGLPGVGVVGGLLGALASAMAGDDDEPWDWKTEYRNLLADTFGKEAGEVIAKGVPRALMPWDISSRVSLSDLWWRDAGREGQSPRESFASDMANILGPTAGSILGWYTAADQMARGDYSKAVEAIVPKFIRDPLKAAREVQDGITSYNGEPLMETTAVEDLGRMLGFSSSRASEMFEARGAVMNAKTIIEDKRSRLLSKMVKARMDGDGEAVAELQSDIDGFNRQHPEFRITSMTIAKSLMTRRRNRANTEDGIMLPDSKDVLRQGGRFAVLE